MGRKRGKYYVNPEELLSDLKHYKATGEITEELGTKFINLAERFASKLNFIEHAYNKEDCIGDAILRMVEQINMIDLDHPKCNPFAYLTQTCKNSFKAKWNKEKKFKNVIEAMTDYCFSEIEANENISFKKNVEDEEDHFE